MTAFDDLLNNPYAQRVYLAELIVYDKVALTTKTLYFVGGKAGFVTKPSDVPSNQYYEPRLENPLTFSQSLYSSGKFGGKSIPGYGAMVLLNNDGGLDAFKDYAVDGRACTIKLGGIGFNYIDFGTIFSGTMQAVEFDSNKLVIRVRDLQYKLDLPLQTTLYLGTGNWEGGADLSSKVKPHCYGQVRNAEPVLVDGANLRYQVHYRNIQAINAVRDAGASLTNFGDYANTTLLDAASIPAGNFATCLAAGVFKLGSSPAGVITADVQGEGLSSYVSTVADIIQRIATTSGGLSVGDLDTATFTTLNTLNSAVVGIYERDQIKIGDAFDKLVNSIGAWYTFSRAGKLMVGRLDTPSGTEAANYTKVDILKFERQPTALPTWRFKLGYKPNWRTLSQSEVASQFRAGGSNASLNGSLTEEYRYVSASDSSVQTAHLLSTDQELFSCLDDSTAAQTECTRLLNLFKSAKDVYKVKVKTQPLSRKMGEVVKLTYSRYGLDSGKLFTIVGLYEDYVRSTVEMELWG